MPRRKKLLRAFGDKVFEVIETQADRLREVGGIGPVRAAPIDEPIRSIRVTLFERGAENVRVGLSALCSSID